MAFLVTLRNKSGLSPLHCKTETPIEVIEDCLVLLRRIDCICLQHLEANTTLP